MLNKLVAAQVPYMLIFTAAANPRACVPQG